MFILIAATKAVNFGKYLSFWKSSKQHTFYLVSILKQMGIKTSNTNMEAKEGLFFVFCFFQISDNWHIGSANQALTARTWNMEVIPKASEKVINYSFWVQHNWKYIYRAASIHEEQCWVMAVPPQWNSTIMVSGALLWNYLECYWLFLVPANILNLVLQCHIASMSYPIYFLQNSFSILDSCFHCNQIYWMLKSWRPQTTKFSMYIFHKC